jgi:hypothetical protein
MGRRKFMQGGSKWSGLDPERLGGHSALDTLAGQSRRKRRDDYQNSTANEAADVDSVDDSAGDSAGDTTDDTAEVRS